MELAHPYFLASLLLVFGFAFGWNNSGLTTGNLSNLVNYRLALILTILGILSGLFVLGNEMSSSVAGKLVDVNIPDVAMIAGLIASISLLIVLTLLRLPVSLSNCAVGSFVGAALASQSSINVSFFVEILGSWIAAPFLCALITSVAYVFVVRIENEFSLITATIVNRMLLIVSVFYVAFALGANNIGLIVSLARPASFQSFTLLEISVFVSSALGMVLFGKSIAKVVGDKIVGLSQIKTLSAMLGSAIITTIFTALAVPVSLTQVVIGGMLGAGVARRPSIVNNRELATLTLGWTLVTIISAALAFVLCNVMIRY